MRPKGPSNYSKLMAKRVGTLPRKISKYSYHGPVVRRHPAGSIRGGRFRAK